MKVSEQIVSILREKERLTLKELYVFFPNNSKDAVRGIVNLLVKNGEVIRVEKATYELPPARWDNA